MHFMNPVPVMALVEIIRGMPTSDEVPPRLLHGRLMHNETSLACAQVTQSHRAY